MSAAWTDPAFDKVARLVSDRTGLTFVPERRGGVELGIRRAMARAGAADLVRYGERIATDSKLLEDLVGELTVGETYFFREPAQFQFVRRMVLPEICAQRGPQQVIRAWSAGCASGEEAYSLAMLFDQEGLAGRSHVLATDLSAAVLAKARRATYGDWSFRGGGLPLAYPYLRRVGEAYVVTESIRDRVQFAILNLAKDHYPSTATGTWGMDLIFCRNVLIYLERGKIREVARRLYESLSVGGWLVTASSDPPLSDEAPFETVGTEHGVFYRRGAAAGVSRSPSLGYGWVPGLGRPAPLALAVPVAGEPAVGRVGATAGSAIAGRSMPAAVAIDDGLGQARAALARGDYARVIEETRALLDEAGACSLYVRAMANLDCPGAERACAEAIARHPFSCELHFLRSALLAQLGRVDDACAEARRVIYLDRSLAIAHFLLGTLLRQGGDRAGAWRAYRNVRDLCSGRPDDEIVPLSDGETAGQLASSARQEMARLEDHLGEAPR